jgi:succinate dehydrogenase/fumarate reductase flavoprotein subunit
MTSKTNGKSEVLSTELVVIGGGGAGLTAAVAASERGVKDRRYLSPLRKPPYYGIQCGLNLMTTHGGIKVNHHMEVLDTKDKPIQGLYAAGVETGGTDSDTYDFHLTGHSFGFTVNSGRIVGETTAKFILGK